MKNSLENGAKHKAEQRLFSEKSDASTLSMFVVLCLT
jgi:hypothetical protein